MNKNSPDSLLPPAAPGLDEPLEMLHACHERIRAQLGTLRRLAEWLPQHGADEQALRAAQAVMRYFDLAAVNHHLDEEDDLLPAMLAAAEESAQTDAAKEAELAALQQLARRVLREHGLLTARWEAVREKLTKLRRAARSSWRRRWSKTSRASLKNTSSLKKVNCCHGRSACWARLSWES